MSSDEWAAWTCDVQDFMLKHAGRLQGTATLPLGHHGGNAGVHSLAMITYLEPIRLKHHAAICQVHEWHAYRRTS